MNEPQRHLVDRRSSIWIAPSPLSAVVMGGAEDLPGELLAAVKASPVASTRQTCLGIDGLSNDVRVSTVAAPE